MQSPTEPNASKDDEFNSKLEAYLTEHADEIVELVIAKARGNLSS